MSTGAGRGRRPAAGLLRGGQDCHKSSFSELRASSKRAALMLKPHKFLAGKLLVGSSAALFAGCSSAQHPSWTVPPLLGPDIRNSPSCAEWLHTLHEACTLPPRASLSCLALQAHSTWRPCAIADVTAAVPLGSESLCGLTDSSGGS